MGRRLRGKNRKAQRRVMQEVITRVNRTHGMRAFLAPCQSKVSGYGFDWHVSRAYVYRGGGIVTWLPDDERDFHDEGPELF